MTTPARLSQNSSRSRSDGCAGAGGLLDAAHNHKITLIFTRKQFLKRKCLATTFFFTFVGSALRACKPCKGIIKTLTKNILFTYTNRKKELRYLWFTDL